MSRRFAEAPEWHGCGRRVVEHVRTVRTRPDVRTPLVPRNGPGGDLGQRVAQELAGETVASGQRDHRHIGAVVVLGRLAARRIEVQRVAGGEGGGIGEVTVVDRLVVREPGEDVERYAVLEGRIFPDRALGRGSTRRHVDLRRPDLRRLEHTADVGPGGCAARCGRGRTLAAAAENDDQEQGPTQHPPGAEPRQGPRASAHVAETKTCPPLPPGRRPSGFSVRAAKARTVAGNGALAPASSACQLAPTSARHRHWPLVRTEDVTMPPRRR